MKHTPEVRALLQHANDISAFEDWLLDRGDSLIEAAELLGGPAWAEEAHAVIGAAAEGIPLSGVWDELVALHRLLNLDYVDDLDSVEADRFLAVHPDDPAADRARHCAEAVDRGGRSLAALASVRDDHSMEAV